MIFVNFWMYIDDMKRSNDENIEDFYLLNNTIRSLFKTKSFDWNNIISVSGILGLVVPFILFWGGMLLPLFTDDIIYICLALVPFYVWCFVFMNVGKTDTNIVVSFLFSFISCFLLSIIVLVIRFSDVSQPFEMTGNMILINFLPSFFITLLAIYIHELHHYQGPDLGYSGCSNSD